MADEAAVRDPNHVPVLLLEKDDGSGDTIMARGDANGRLKATATVSAAAPADATYVTLSTNATLTNERVLTGTANQVTVTDNGAGSTVVLSLPQSIATTSSPTFSTLTLGTTTADAGVIRLANNTGINARNAANSGNLNVISTDTSNRTLIGNATGASLFMSDVGFSSDNTYDIGGGTRSPRSIYAKSNLFVGSTLTQFQVTSAGAVTAASINGLTVSASTGTLTIANGSTLVTSGANSITLTSTGATNVTLPTTGTLATLAGTEELDNKTLDSSVGKGTWTASGTWTLPAFTAGGAIQLTENNPITFDAASSADGTYSGFVRAGTAGTTLAFGDLVYLAAADSRWELADADAASTSGDVLLGMCVLAAASDGSATTILLQGFIRADAAFPTLTIGAPAYVSTTAGDIQVAQPSGTDDVIRRVGFAWTADELYFNPSNDYITHT